jgi:hypothetical protein
MLAGCPRSERPMNVKVETGAEVQRGSVFVLG